MLCLYKLEHIGGFSNLHLCTFKLFKDSGRHLKKGTSKFIIHVTKHDNFQLIGHILMELFGKTDN